MTIDRHNDSGSKLSRASSPVAPPPQTYTQSGRSVRFPRCFNNFLPEMRTAAPVHIPSKDTVNPLQVIENPMSHPTSLENTNSANGIEEESRSHVASDES